MSDAPTTASTPTDRELLLERLVDAAETDRGRLAADLHDQPVQLLAAVDLRLGLLEQAARREQVPSTEQLLEVRAIVNRTTASLRSMMSDLEPPDSRDTLGDVVRQVVEPLLGSSRLHLTPEVDDLTASPAVLRQVARVLRDALAVVPRRGQVAVSAVDGGAWIVVLGLDQGAALDAAGLADRAALVGGRLEVITTDTDSRVELWVPAGA